MCSVLAHMHSGSFSTADMSAVEQATISLCRVGTRLAACGSALDFFRFGCGVSVPAGLSVTVEVQAGFSVEVDVAELWPSVVNRVHACSKVWLCCFRTCKNVELVAHHAEVNPLPAQRTWTWWTALASQLEARRRRTLRLPQSSRGPRTRRCQHLLFSSSASRHGSSLPRHTALWAQSWRNLRFRARPFRGLVRVLLFWRLSQHGSVFFRVCLDPCLHTLLQRAQFLVFSKMVVLQFCLFCVFLDCFLPLGNHFGNPCGSFVNRSWCVVSSPQFEAACSFATNELCAIEWRTALETIVNTALKDQYFGQMWFRTIGDINTVEVRCGHGVQSVF